MLVVNTELNNVKYEFPKKIITFFTLKSSDPISDPDADADPMIYCASDRLDIF